MNTGEQGSNFYLGFLFLSRPKREALSAVYAFCRHVDDVADSGACAKDEAAKQLDFWQEEVERLYSGSPTHDLSRRLLPFVESCRLPKEGFSELVRGVRMDLEKSRYETFEELEPYLFGVAGAVGLLCVEIFGYRSTPAADIRSYALSMGNAFQLTNILRDVGADLERGRIYLPAKDMAEAGYCAAEFMRREHSPAFERLMRLEYARAKAFYRKARGLLHPDDRPSMTAAEVMAQVYEELLERMREEGFRVFFRRMRVPAWRKAVLALRGWAASRGLWHPAAGEGG